MGVEIKRLVKVVDDLYTFETTVPSAQALTDSRTRDATPDTPDLQKERTLDGMNRALLQIAFNHENRIRALELKPPVTAAQFRTAIKALL